MTHPIVACARGWIGTRFHHQGRLRRTAAHRGGVDCLGLLVGVAAELDLRAADGTRLAGLDETDYAHRPDAGRLRARLGEVLREIELKPSLFGRGQGGATEEAPVMWNRPHPAPLPEGEVILLPGDIALLRIDGSPQHLAIISDFAGGMGLIHAYAPARAVVEHRLDAWWRERIEAIFRSR